MHAHYRDVLMHLVVNEWMASDEQVGHDEGGYGMFGVGGRLFLWKIYN